MQEWLPLIVPLIVAVIGGLFAWITTRINRRGVQENVFIDQLQEERTGDRAEIADIRARQLLLEDYIYELRDHIDQRKPPPPPPWPKELTRKRES